MSTHIYNAYRLLRKADLWPLIHDIRLKGEKAVQRDVRKLYSSLMGSVDESSSAYEKALRDSEGDVWLAKFAMTQKAIREGYKANSTSMLRDPFNLDVSVAVRQYKGRIYLQGFCDWTVGKSLDFLAKDSRLVDFHFQNSTDKPKDVSKGDWAKRRRVWYGMDDADQWFDVLTLEVCSFASWWRIDPGTQIFREHNKLTTRKTRGGRTG